MVQASFLHYRFQHIDYLPEMFAYRLNLMSREPAPIASYETLMMPFGPETWALIVASVVAIMASMALASACLQNGFNWFRSEKAGLHNIIVKLPDRFC